MNDQQPPRAPRRRWLVLLGLGLTYATTNGILIHTLPLVYPYLIDTFQWSQAQVTLPATVFFVVGAVTSPPAGVLLDRFSARWIIALGLAGMIVSFLFYAAVTGLEQLVVVYAVLATCLSMSGLVSNMLILSRWFTDQRGRATGIFLMSSSIGGAIFPLVMGYFLETVGWRATMQVLAAIAVAFALLPIILLVRDFPNAQPANPGRTKDRRIASSGPKLRQAILEPRFYLVALATGAVWFSLIGMTQHQSIYLANDVGIARTQLPTIFSTFFVFSTLGKPLFGWLSDHINKTLMMLAAIGTMAVGLLLLRNVDLAGSLTLYGYAIVAGAGFAGAFTMIQLLFAEFYAGHSYGKILAILVMVDTLAGALGTRVIGLLREAGGSYHGGIDLMIGLLVLAFVCTLIVRSPSARR